MLKMTASKVIVLIILIADQLFLSISFRDPNGEEKAFCSLPNPTTTCFTTLKNTSKINQDLPTKETSLTMLQVNDKDRSGQWSCLHGTQTEKATTFVKDEKRNIQGQPNTSFTVVKLEVPKYIKRGEYVNFECSIADSLKTEGFVSITFLINDAPVVKFRKTRVSCQLWEPSEQCKDNSCLCLDGGTRYVVQHKVFNVADVIKFTCNVESELGVIFRDCSLSRIIDMDGPHISTDVAFPVDNGTSVQFNCSVDVPSYMVYLVWNCPQQLPEGHQNLGHGQFITSSHVIDSSLDNENCTCSAYIKDSLIASASFQIITKHIPVIAKSTNKVCPVSGAVTLTCSVVNVNDFFIFGFSNWTHTRNGKVIKHLEGSIKGNTAVLYILNCKSDDSGEYTCNIWTQNFNYKTWTNKTIDVGVEDLKQNGKPITEYIPYIVSGSIVILIGLFVIVKRHTIGNHDAIAVYHAAPSDQISGNLYQSCDLYDEIGTLQGATPLEQINEYEEANKYYIDSHENEIVSDELINVYEMANQTDTGTHEYEVVTDEPIHEYQMANKSDTDTHEYEVVTDEPIHEYQIANESDTDPHEYEIGHHYLECI